MTKRLKYIGEIRDPIHGLIPLTEIEFKIIDTSPFQRLRGIKQLAMAHLGFPGANHTRFEHSIGVMHVTSKIIQHLENEGLIELDKETEQNIRLAGLLHDIGHGPFSHVSENLLEFYAGENNDAKSIHEEISRRIITENKEILDILGENRLKEITSILETDRIDLDYKHDIISGPLDGDKMDYLLRDSYYAGVKYGIFDIERLINVLTIIKDGKQKRLAVESEGLETVEQYVLAKYFITQQVYQHKTRLITDLMIVEGIKNAIESGNRNLKQIYFYNDSKDFINNYLTSNDYKTIDEVLSSKDKNSIGYYYFKKLYNRKLLKELFRIKYDNIEKRNPREAYKKFIALKKNDCDDLKKQISDKINLNNNYTHIKVFTMKDPLIQNDSILDENAIIIRIDENNLSILDEESILFKNIMQDAKSSYISIFGVPKVKFNKKEKIKNNKLIKEILIQHFGDNHENSKHS